MTSVLVARILPSTKMDHNAKEDDGSDELFSDNDDVTSDEVNDVAVGMDSPETACYSEPSSPNIDNDRDDTKMQSKPSDHIQMLSYGKGRLHPDHQSHREDEKRRGI